MALIGGGSVPRVIAGRESVNLVSCTGDLGITGSLGDMTGDETGDDGPT